MTPSILPSNRVVPPERFLLVMRRHSVNDSWGITLAEDQWQVHVVRDGSRAMHSGLRQGDYILTVNGIAVRNQIVNDLMRKETTVTLDIERPTPIAATSVSKPAAVGVEHEAGIVIGSSSSSTSSNTSNGNSSISTQIAKTKAPTALTPRVDATSHAPEIALSTTLVEAAANNSDSSSVPSAKASEPVQRGSNLQWNTPEVTSPIQRECTTLAALREEEHSARRDLATAYVHTLRELQHIQAKLGELHATDNQQKVPPPERGVKRTHSAHSEGCISREHAQQEMAAAKSFSMAMMAIAFPGYASSDASTVRTSPRSSSKNNNNTCHSHDTCNVKPQTLVQYYRHHSYI